MTSFIRLLGMCLLFAGVTACGGSDSDGSAAPASGVDAAPGAPAPDNSSSALPRVYIATEGGVEVTSTDDYLNGTVRVLSGNGDELLQASTEVRGRGNTTWGMPKKPYRLKLNTAAAMLGMPAERDWALLANYADKSLVRNKVAMVLGEQAGLAWNPRSVFIELYFNDAYQGVYQLFEHVKVGPNRVNIDELDKDSDIAPELITGGHFLEVDHRLDEDVCWFTSMNIPICSKNPEYDVEDISDPAHASYAQYNYIKNYLDAAEQAISTPGNSYQDYFDVEAMASWYLVTELMKSNEAQINSVVEGSDNFTSSVFLYKPRGGKLNFGPLWDYDLAAGNINYNGNFDPTGWFIRNSEWHRRLFEHSDFGQHVFAKWCELERGGVIAGLGEQIDTIVAGVDRAAIDRNFERWDILGTYVWPNAFVGDTYDEEVDYLKTWLTTRAEWMRTEYAREFGQCPAS
jgi:hypothetical protein